MIPVALIQSTPHDESALLQSALLRAECSPIITSPTDPLEKWNTAQVVILLSIENQAQQSTHHTAKHLSLITQLKKHHHQGNLILGIGNGARILLESGLIPGLEEDKAAISINTNDTPAKKLGFACLSKDYQRNAFTRQLSLNHRIPLSNLQDYSQTAIIPPMLWQEMQMQGLNLLHYCNEMGAYQATSDTVVAMSNKAGNVMALLSPLQYDTEEAHALFKSMRDSLTENKNKHKQSIPLYYYPRS